MYHGIPIKIPNPPKPPDFGQSILLYPSDYNQNHSNIFHYFHDYKGSYKA